MTRRKILFVILTINVLISLIINNIEITSLNETEKFDFFEPNYVPVTIRDFSDFDIYDNNSLIDSTNYDTHITFDYMSGAASSIRENYVLPFDSYGDCSYFDIRLKFHYETYDLGVSAMLSFYLYAGSYYDYLGNYIGTDYSVGSNHLSFAGIYDSWSGSRGEYVSVAYVNDVFTRYETGHILPYSGDLTIQLTRNESGLFSIVYDTYSNQEMIGHNWIAGIDKPVNFIMLGFTNGVVNVDSHVIAYDIEGEFIFDDYPDTIDPVVNITYPSDSQYIQADSATIIWDGYDLESGIANYYTRIDSEAWIDVGLDTVYTFYNLTYGTHIVDVVIVDNEDNNATNTISFFSNFTVIEPDLSNPYVLILTPGNESILDSGDVIITWIGYDLETGITGYNIKNDDQSWIDVELSTEHTFYDLANGNHIVYVEAIDNSLNSYVCQTNFIVSIFDPSYDLISPSVTIISPINGSIIPVHNITATWEGYDSESGIADYYVRLDDGNWFNIDLDTSCDFNKLKDGLHTLKVKAVDNYGNEFIAESIFTINTSTTTEEGSGFNFSITIISLTIAIIGVQLIKRKK